MSCWNKLHEMQTQDILITKHTIYMSPQSKDDIKLWIIEFGHWAKDDIKLWMIEFGHWAKDDIKLWNYWVWPLS